MIYLGTGSTLRRQERARCFLHLLEVGLKQGQSIERTVMSLSRSRVQTLGVYLHLLAAYLESGLPFNTALEEVPRLLPSQVRAMLRVGQEIGNIAKVLPACRNTLRDGISGTRTSVNNLAVLLFASPVGAALIWFCSIRILPRFREITRDFEVPIQPWTNQLIGLSLTLSVVVVVIWLTFCLAALMQSGGPFFVSWIEMGLWPASHRLSFWLPWRRKRMQRDFSVMLALLLDSEASEEQAVRLAAASTANRIFMRRAERVVRDLHAGVKLTEAVRWLDDAGEFRWRLGNACRIVGQASSLPPPLARTVLSAGSGDVPVPSTPPSRPGFFAALTGWHESLEARAFQQEQAVSQTITTGFVLLNGLMVGLLATGIFRLLIAMVEEATLW